MLDKVQQSAISLPDDPEPSLLPCPMECRREAAAVGLWFEVIDSEGRRQANELKPEHTDPSQTPLIGDQNDLLLQRHHHITTS